MSKFSKVLSFIAASSICAFAAWDGTIVEPSKVKKIDGMDYYVLSTAEELAWYASKTNAGVVLNGYIDADINLGEDENSLSSTNWVPIGNESNNFKAVLLGNGHSVNGVKIPSSGSVNGFFGVIAKSGIVSGLNIASSNIQSSTVAGGVVGKNYGTIKKVSYAGSVKVDFGSQASGKTAISGGVAGYNEGKIIACTNRASVSAAGGTYNQVSGWTGGSTITGNLFSGGIVGQNAGQILLCENTSSVQVNESVNHYGRMYGWSGGIAGSSSGSISDCLNRGSVSSTGSKNSACGSYTCDLNTYAGGIAGKNSGTIGNVINVATSISGGKKGNFVADGTTTVSNGYNAPEVTDDFIELMNTSNGTRENSGYWDVVDGEISLNKIADGKIFVAWNGSSSEPELIEKDDHSYYLITSTFEFAWFANAVNNGQTDIDAELGNDIVFGENESSLSLVTWVPVGNTTNQYEGLFDGKGFNIYGINVSSENGGLFGVVGKNGKVKNLHVKNSKINHTSNGGGIVARNFGSVENVSFSGQIVTSASGQTISGGVVGLNEGSISNVSVEGSVTGSKSSRSDMGGIVGRNSGSVFRAYNYAKVSASTVASYGPLAFAGGIAGFNTGSINTVMNEASVYGSAVGENSCGYTQIGGIAGENNGVIANAINKGGLSKGNGCNTTDHYAGIGGLVGANRGSAAKLENSFGIFNSLSGSSSYQGAVVGINQSSAQINNCFFDNQLYDKSAVGNNGAVSNNVVGLPTAELKDAAFAWLLNTTNETAAHSGVWSFDNGYPFFADENNKPIYRLTFNDGISNKYQYSTYLGAVSSPEKPEPDLGYTFVAWVDENGVVFRARNSVTEDKTYYAVFALDGAPQYVITFVDGNQIFSLVTSSEGTLADIPEGTSAPKGYEFDGWYVSKTNSKITTETVFNESTTITAKYIAKLYKITFLDYDESVYIEDMWPYGNLPKVEAPIRKRTDEYTYSFKEWSPEITSVISEAVYIAKYDSSKTVFCDIFFNGEKKTYAIGDMLVLPDAPLKDGFVFIGWYTIGGIKVGNAGDVIEVLEGMELIAEYEEIIQNSSSSTIASLSSSSFKSESSSSEREDNLSSCSAQNVNFSSSSVIVSSSGESSSSSMKTIASSSSVKDKSSSSSKEIASSSSKNKSSSSSFKSESSSSEREDNLSSCSAQNVNFSSSSVIVSSSGESSSSSMKTIASSSSVKDKSSSSSKGKDSKSSSSKDGKDAIVAMQQVPQFSLVAMGRDIQVAGARMGSAYAVFDMQGHVMVKGRVEATNFDVPVNRAGSYLVRIGNQVQKVNVR